MNQRQLKTAINSGKVSNLYIFCGEDYFLKNLYVKRIAKTKNATVKRIAIETEEELKEANARALSGSLFEKKPTLFHCLLGFEPKKNTIKPPHFNILILDVESCKKEDEYTVKFEPPKRSEIASFIKGVVSKAKKDISNEAIELLTAAFEGKSTAMLKNTLDEILLLSLNKQKIEADDVKACLKITSNIDIKEIIDLTRKGSLQQITERLDEILSQMPPQLFIHIFSSEITKIIASCYLSDNCLKEHLRVYYPSNYKQLCKRIGKNNLLKLVKSLYEIDKILKSSSEESTETIIKARLMLWAQGF
ncbi:DNA polymerase III subunit delta [Hippea sp. KM1]|uniref:DNA polymerase III subunit delta n=1 Tax=Hippea sp. KM1 TaxID=944481 RepID=UPI00046CFBD9|nr:hypothetical protein [Hippea sp. KM1]